MKPKKLLLVDDEYAARVVMRDRLLSESFDIIEAETGEEAVRSFESESPDLVLMDVNLGEGIDGFEATNRIKELAENRFVPVILCTVREDIESKKIGLEYGADDYITKPFEMTELVVRVRSMLRIQDLAEKNQKLRKKNQKLAEQGKRLKKENEDLRSRLVWSDRTNPIVDQSPAMQSILRLAEKVAMTSETVLITGETGVGKELVARLIHQNSDRNERKLLILDCPSIPDQLFESELFGHKKGSFSGAYNDRVGILTEGDGATVLLDEIGDIPLPIQAKLLRFLQEGTMRRVGSNQNATVNVRIIAATNRNLETMVKQGKFRQDLFFRLNVLRIHVPTLWERKEDIPELAGCFLDHFNVKQSKNITGFSPGALRGIERGHYAGNVRQLKNTVTFAATLANDGEQILPEHVAEALVHFEFVSSSGDYSDKMNLKTITEDTERKIIKSTLDRLGQDRTRTAKALGITRQGLWKKMRKLGMFKDG